MKRKIEMMTTGRATMFSRDGFIRSEHNDILMIQHRIHNQIPSIKAIKDKVLQQAAADTLVRNCKIDFKTALEVTDSEQAIRDYARSIW